MNHPHLQLVYLPHLDYNLQRLGPDSPEIARDLAMIDHEAGRLLDFAREQGADVMVVSEYGITQVTQSVSVNRVLREAGLLRVRESLGWELLDCGSSRAFAVADHQVAHVYIKDPADLSAVKSLLQAQPGIEQVLDDRGQQAYGLAHPRAGELVLIAEPGCWFNYYYWLEDSKAPDFARTVDIHRKPGYDPAELFVDPTIQFVKLKIAARLLQKKLGQRMLMDVIPLDPSLVKGSHGRLAERPEDGPIFITNNKQMLDRLNQPDCLPMQQVCGLLQQHFQ
ncbi:alkaline phosphatase family protein [Photobacterium sp. Hal280]